MNTIVKTSMALAVAGVLSAAAITPSAARDRAWVAAGAGFAAGALIGAAAANANNGYYYTSPGYGYAEPEYGYEPAPAYVYEPAPTYYAPGYRVGSPNYNYNPYQCSSDEGYGRRSGCDR